MKNTVRLLTAMALTAFFITGLQAQTTSAGQSNTDKKSTVEKRPAYVDKNNDGVCDNYASGRYQGHGAGFIDKNNDGICDNCGSGRYQGRGANFVDKNNDGIYDNRQNAAANGNAFRHRGNAYHNRNGHGNCCGNVKPSSPKTL